MHRLSGKERSPLSGEQHQRNTTKKEGEAWGTEEGKEGRREGVWDTTDTPLHLTQRRTQECVLRKDKRVLTPKQVNCSG